ncbi:hypothetical protein ACTG0T_02095 [Halococcus morrhuae DSM 1307]|uniref:hypothetical protein n=1 Tax=Halococcus morrhuae TaxID=2250 RepID=UPI00126744E8|nr:hypothetical protein [Halococcus morrhuae]
MSSKNDTDRFGSLEKGLREDKIEGKVINWLTESVRFADFDNYTTSINDPSIIYGSSGIKAGNYGENFIGMVDVSLTIDYGDFTHGIGIECKGRSTGKNDIDVMKHGIGQTVIYDQSEHDSYLSVPTSMVDSRGIAAARQADVGLIGVSNNSINIVVSNGAILPHLSDLQYKAAAKYATCDYCGCDIDTTASQMEDFEYNFCGEKCLEQWDSKMNAMFYD